MNTIFRRLMITVFVCAAVAAGAQATPPSAPGILIASNFAQWNLPQGSSPAAGSISWTPAFACTVNSSGNTFTAIRVGRPVTIVDSNPANTETVIPTSVIINSNSCTMNAPMVHVHNSYYVTSGTFGLQEAIDYTGSNLTSVVQLTPSWTRLGGITSMVTSAYGNTNVSILDQRTALCMAYIWNGSAYVGQSCGGSSGGGLNPGAQTQLVNYANPGTSTVGGPTNLTTDVATHKQLHVPSILVGGRDGTFPVTEGYLAGTPGMVNAVTECGVPTDHVTPMAAILNACLLRLSALTSSNFSTSGATRKIFFPRTNLAIGAAGVACDYMVETTIIMPHFAFELAMGGENGNGDTQPRFCQISTGYDMFDINSSSDLLENVSIRGAAPWHANDSTTYTLGGTDAGVRICGGYVTLRNVSVLWMNGPGVLIPSSTPSGCQGPPVDDLTSDDWMLINVHTVQNRADGVEVRGSDSNIGIVQGGRADQNQLFGFQDTSLYPATVIGLETNGNHHDTEAGTNPVNIVNISTSAGLTTVNCASACGMLNGAYPFITGTSNSGYNNLWADSPAISTGTGATSFTMLTGDAGPNDGSTSTGGTVSTQPGANIWAAANVTGGGGYANLVQAGTYIAFYCEGNETCLTNSGNLTCINCQGIASTPVLAYNNGGVGIPFTNVQTGSSANPQQSYWNSTQWSSTRNMNQFTRRMMGTFFRPAAGTSGGGGIDCAWSAQAGAPLVGSNEVAELCRSSTAANTDGYWAFTDLDAGIRVLGNTWLRFYDRASTSFSPGTLQFGGAGTTNSAGSPRQPHLGEHIADDFATESANPALAGVFRMSQTDSTCWRNVANSGDDCLTVDGTDNLNFNGTPFSGANGIVPFSSTGISTMTAATTYFITTAGIPAVTGSIGSFGLTLPFNGALGNLTIHLAGNVAAGDSIAFTVTNGNTPTTLACTIGTGANTCSDTTHFPTAVAGNTITLAAVCTGTCGSSPVPLSALLATINVH